MPAQEVGPLGAIRGLTWDPARKRYFPTPKDPLPTPGPSRPMITSQPVLPSTECLDGKSGRRYLPGAEAKGSGHRRRIGGGQRMREKGDLIQRAHLANLSYDGSSRCCSCQNERITTLQTFHGNACLAATDSGKVLVRTHEGRTHALSICSEPIVGMHHDIARMTNVLVAGGANPHLHIFRHQPTEPDEIDALTVDLEHLNDSEIQSFTAYDDTIVLGASRSLTTIQQYSGLRPSVTTRKLHSDPLALDFGKEANLVYAGMRDASVLLHDLRTPGVYPNTVCRVRGGKAVVGVKRLDDAAVPFGLVASAMGNELLIFDIRFGRQPLHTLPHHINTYHFNVALATSPDSRYVFASGSDRRIGLWSTTTGERVHPAPSKDDDGKEGKDMANPLARVFPGMVQKLAVRDDLGLEVGCGGEVIHFGRAAKSRDSNEWE